MRQGDGLTEASPIVVQNFLKNQLESLSFRPPHPEGDLTGPGELGGEALPLVSPASDYITGVVLPVNGPKALWLGLAPR